MATSKWTLKKYLMTELPCPQSSSLSPSPNSQEPETSATKHWKEDSLVREVEAGRGQMISRTGQTEQWRSVHSWRRTGSDEDCWYTSHK